MSLISDVWGWLTGGSDGSTPPDSSGWVETDGQGDFVDADADGIPDSGQRTGGHKRKATKKCVLELKYKSSGAEEGEPPPTSNVIYSFCFDSTDGKQKIFYVCYAFKFYEEYSYLYVPKAFCIVSQYPYFTLFQYIHCDI